ncbi:hypothetical protein FACS1894154_12430 [Betaproteobacteria bacterium]|nr:hypothetical protein FACS1894154_12430 [Betaproteobacteria bacterium]GHU32867.1 hypothetical protein FACS189497_14590 [Betaproteobacteria bacterium]
MGWEPISESELASWVEQAYAAMTGSERRQFDEIRIPLRRLFCQRSPMLGPEVLYAVARRGRQYLIFDDVEEDFGIATHSGDEMEVLNSWVLVGELQHALHTLLSGDYGNCVIAPGGYGGD